MAWLVNNKNGDPAAGVYNSLLYFHHHSGAFHPQPLALNISTYEGQKQPQNLTENPSPPSYYLQMKAKTPAQNDPWTRRTRRVSTGTGTETETETVRPVPVHPQSSPTKRMAPPLWSPLPATRCSRPVRMSWTRTAEKDRRAAKEVVAVGRTGQTTIITPSTATTSWTGHENLTRTRWRTRRTKTGEWTRRVVINIDFSGECQSLIVMSVDPGLISMTSMTCLPQRTKNCWGLCVCNLGENVFTLSILNPQGGDTPRG